MVLGVRARRVWPRTWRAVKRLAPPRLTPRSLEGRVLAVAWTLAALLTLGVALAQSLPMFLASLVAVSFGTYAAMWLLTGAARR